MRRNPLTQTIRDAARQARIEQSTAADAAPGSLDEQSGGSAGTVSSGGTWQPYGLLDWTPLDTTPFRLT